MLKRIKTTRTGRGHRLAVEALETRTLLAIDMLANVTLDEGAIFRPRDLVGFQGQIVFRGDDGFLGPEAWISSGDPADVRLLKDINTGVAGSGPRDFTEYEGRLFFAATNGGNGYELWVTQGSKASTQLMGDIWPGRESGVPTELTVFNGLMYFFANDGESGRELYQSDGTPQGTIRVADSIAGRGGSSGERMTIAGDKMYFSSDTSEPGLQGLWVSDGTAAGTMHVGIEAGNIDRVDNLTPFGDRLLFSVDSRVFVTDGTAEGTTQLPPVPGTSSSERLVTGIHVSNGRVLVTFSESSLAAMYEPDLKSGSTLQNAQGIHVASGRVYHWSETGLYVLEPDVSSTRLLGFNSFFGTRMTNTTTVENGMLFAINRTLDRYEIWSTNGTPDGTKMVDQVTDSSSEPLLGFQQIGDAIYFAATNGELRESLWKVDAPDIEPAEIDVPSLPGDVTADAIVDSRDVDAVFAAAMQGSTDANFDTNGDGQVSASDGIHIVETILQTKAGDLDLNGKIEFADFLVLSTNFGKDDASYDEGDVDGDGLVAFADFLLLSTNFGFDRG